MATKQPLLIVFLIIPFLAQSQEKFVEVTVSDTAWVKPNVFGYTIGNNPMAEYDPTDSSTNDLPDIFEKKKEERLLKEKRVLDSLRGVLSKLGFNVSPANSDGIYSTNDEPGLEPLQVLTHSLDSIKIMYSLIVSNKAFYGGITFVKADNEDVYFKKLFQKLLVLAKQKADMIAALTNLKVGNIISFKEDATETSGGWTAYPPLSSLSSNSYYLAMLSGNVNGIEKNKTELYKIEKKITVRFLAQ